MNTSQQTRVYTSNNTYKYTTRIQLPDIVFCLVVVLIRLILFFVSLNNTLTILSNTAHKSTVRQSKKPRIMHST